jgi:octanoyl-[GcvH]:protein N-octanoyltransferase
MDLLTIAHPSRPEIDMAFTGALLEAVASREAPDTIRVFRPGPTVAFGRSDRIRAGFDEACRVTQSHGRTPIVRLGGGHAAAYDSDCLVVEVMRQHQHGAMGGLEGRFLHMVDLLQRGLAGIGVTAELGQLQWEYCPGRYSLHLPSGPKIAGIAQRVLTRASLTTAVIVVDGANTLRRTLTDVYAALDLPLDIATAGAIADQHPGVSSQALQEEIAYAAAATFRMPLPREAKDIALATRRAARGLPENCVGGDRPVQRLDRTRD